MKTGAAARCRGDRSTGGFLGITDQAETARSQRAVASVILCGDLHRRLPAGEHYSIVIASGGPIAAACRSLGARDMGRFALALLAAGWIAAMIPRAADAQYSPYHFPPPGYGPRSSYGPPPCAAVTPGPFAGAARGAAGGALFGAIGGNAGRGAAIGAAIGGVGGAIRRGTARSSGACY